MFITVVCCLLIGFVNGASWWQSSNCLYRNPGYHDNGKGGIAQIANNNYNTDSIGDAGKDFRNFFYYGSTLGLYAVWIAFVIWFIFNFILGRPGQVAIFHVGSNIAWLNYQGVNIFSTTTKAYLVSSFCSCIVGLIICHKRYMGTHGPR